MKKSFNSLTDHERAKVLSRQTFTLLASHGNTCISIDHPDYPELRSEIKYTWDDLAAYAKDEYCDWRSLGDAFAAFPPDEEVDRMCDEVGLIVSDEVKAKLVAQFIRDVEAKVSITYDDWMAEWRDEAKKG